MSNATITVTINGKSTSFDLNGSELSFAYSPTGNPDGRDLRYLGNATKDHIGEQVEKALKSLQTEAETEAEIAAANAGDAS